MRTERNLWLLEAKTSKADATGTTVQSRPRRRAGPWWISSARGGRGRRRRWQRYLVRHAAATFNGTGGHDILFGGPSDDWIFAGSGFDFVDGGAGVDRLSLVFGTGISPSDIHLAVSSSGTDLIATVRDPANAAAADEVRLQDWFNWKNQIETFAFADGTIWNMTAMLTGTAGDDQLYGGTGANALFGGAGNDTYIIDNPGDAAVNALMAANVSMAGSRNSCRRSLLA
jgi:Ca2+-binding RTX toxin-like protein